MSDWAEQVKLLGAFFAGIGSVLSALLIFRRAGQQLEQSRLELIISGYDKLVEDLRADVAHLRKEVAELKKIVQETEGRERDCLHKLDELRHELHLLRERMDG